MDSDELRKMMDSLEASGDPAWEKLFTLNNDFQQIAAEANIPQRQPRPHLYYRDGTPILDDELLPAVEKWAMLFEQKENRIIGQHRTLYGEKLSTVFLGLDHSFSMTGPPILYETMLFAPGERTIRISAKLRGLSTLTAEEREAEKAEEREKARRYPHDQLQLRYTNEDEARESHLTLRVQTLIPPRWRHFLLWTIGRDETWRFYNEDED
jgi:hypothetical protein